MQIHTLKPNETINDIAKEYGTTEERIRENNDAAKYSQAGGELLILTPTRAYRFKSTDTLEAVACRFGVSVASLSLKNPKTAREKSLSGCELAVKYPFPSHGCAAANGYVYSSTSEKKIRFALPYITYLTVCAYRINGGKLERVFDPKRAVRLTKESGKIPLLRIYDGTDGVHYSDKDARKRLIEKMVAVAISGGFAGITLCAYEGARQVPDDFLEFLVEARRMMIGSDLVLFVETDETLPTEICELADGGVFMQGLYDQAGQEIGTCRERKTLEKFQNDTETSKVFIDISADAYVNGNPASYLDALALAKKYGEKIETDENTLISKFTYNDKGVKREALFSSLKKTKATLDLVSELGFMGISFDVEKVPTEHLMMFSTMFAPAHYHSPFSLPM